MANIARVTQSFALAGTLQNGTARVTQSYVLLGVGIGITCGNPPPGNVGAAYSHTFPSGGGQAPLTFSITAGSLPAGLSLDAATGIVSGTPTGPGSFPFTIQVVDALMGTASVSCSITVSYAVIIQLIGWKLYPDAPCENALPKLELPSVDRAV
jgi:hypothetical protein